MNHTSFKIAAAALAVASALSSTAYAGGFQLTEQSALALGRAYAGVGVDGTDVSGMYPENRGIYTQSDSSKKSSRNIWSLAVVSVDQRY